MTPLVGRALRLLPGTSLTIGPPRGLARTLEGYVKDRGGLGDRYVEVHPSATIRRTPPHVVDGEIDRSFSIELHRSLPSAGAAVIAGGRVLTATGAVIGPDDRLVADVSDMFLTADPWANSLLVLPKLPPVTHLTGDVGVLTTYRSDIYYHWLLDTLPRLHLLQAAGFSFDTLVVPQRTRYQRESVEMLGLGATALISEPGLHLQAASLLVPSLPGMVGNPPAWACEFLRDSFLADVAPASTGSPRIFVSRQRARSRIVTNEEELFDSLRPFGFHKLCLEDLSFREQVDAFHHAEMVVAPHGSGLANLVFCRPGTKVMELFSPNYVNVMYWALADQLGLDYSYLVGAAGSAPPAHRGRRVHEDIFVDTGTVGRALRMLLDR